MNESKLHKVRVILFRMDSLNLSGIEYLEIACAMIKINKNLIKDYPSLEDALKDIESVISREQD